MGAETIALSALAFVLTYAIHSTLLLGLACLAASRITALRVRDGLWKLALFGGLVTAGVQVGCGLHTPLAHWSLVPPPVVAHAPTGTSQPSTVEVDDAQARKIAEQATVALELALLRLARLEQPLHNQTPRVAPIDPSTGHLPSVAPVSESPTFVASSSPQSESTRLVPVAAAPETEPPLAAVVTPAADWTQTARRWLPSLASNWRAWLTRGLVAWAAFSAAICALFAWMWLRLARRLRGRVELTRGAMRVTLDRLVPLAFPRGRRIRLFVAPELGAPLSFGWLRASICIPPRALVELTHEEQETMLAHELAHLKRRDPVWLSLAWFVERVFFFQPLNRVARAQLHDAAELLCDEWAVRRTGNRVALASCLARIAGWIVGPARALPATSMADGHGRSRLGQRIERLLDERALRHEEYPRSWVAPLAASALGAAVLVVPGVSAERWETENLHDKQCDVVEIPDDDSEDEQCDLSAKQVCDLDLAAAESGVPSDAEIEAALAAAQAESRLPSPDATPAAEPDAEETAAATNSEARATPEEIEPSLGLAATHEALSALDSLDEAVLALERELAALRAALGDLDDDDELAPALEQLEQRAEHLDQRRTQLRRLLFQVVSQVEQEDSDAASDEFELDAR